jgi:hypothetical protein
MLTWGYQNNCSWIQKHIYFIFKIAHVGRKKYLQGFKIISLVKKIRSRI